MAVEWDTANGPQTGVYISRRDSDSWAAPFVSSPQSLNTTPIPPRLPARPLTGTYDGQPWRLPFRSCHPPAFQYDGVSQSGRPLTARTLQSYALMVDAGGRRTA